MHGMRGVQGIRGEAACSGPAGTGPGSGCGDAPGQRRRQADDQRTEPVQHASGRAHAGGPQIAQRGRIEVLEGVDGGKRQPHLARGDADLGAADDDDADGSGEDLEPAAGRGPEQRAGPHRSGRRARVPASPPDCPAGLERARGTGRRHRQRAQSVVTANPLGGIPIQSKQ